tara:strand:+ start:35 stop:478 length:444 start_codon:yes stop_codon:yes gene_type:complete
MAALAQQLEQLKKQQEELEKRIQEEAETKKKLNKEASIERLEALVEPMTENLNQRDNRVVGGGCIRDVYIMQYEGRQQQAHNEMINPRHSNHNIQQPRKEIDLEREEIYVTLIGILKKQDQKIKGLENLVNNIKPHFVNSKYSYNDN